MGKTDSIDSDNTGRPHDGTAAAAADAAQAQLALFDSATSPTMTNENPAPAERIRADAQEGAPCTPSADSAAGTAAEVEATPAAGAGAEAEAEIRINAPLESLGQRLRAAREARGMRCDEAAQAMRLPLLTVQALEADRYERIGEGIYLRSYLSKYLRLLDLPQVLAERVLTQHAEPPPLVTSGTISRPRYLFERYSSSALYLILTAVIIVPAVWLAMRAGLEPNLVQITPLDGPDAAVSSPSNMTNAGGAAAQQSTSGDTQAGGTAHTVDEPPLVASLAPFPTMKRDNAEAEATEHPAAPVPGEHALRLTLAEPSWVEIVAADGEKLEYGLLGAGTTRTYHSAKAIDVRVGNANGASVEVDGKAQDLSAFRHANVAHFKLAGGENTISHSGG